MNNFRLSPYNRSFLGLLSLIRKLLKLFKRKNKYPPSEQDFGL